METNKHDSIWGKFETITPEIVLEDSDREEDLALIKELDAIFHSCPEDQMFRSVLTVVLTTLESTYGVFGYLDDNGALICPFISPDNLEQSKILNMNIILKPDEWDVFWSYAVKEMKTYCSNKPLQPPKRQLPINNALTVPIIHDDKVIGLICVGDKKTDYSKRDIELLEAIARHFAPVLHSGLETDRFENLNPSLKDADKDMKLLNKTHRITRKANWEDKSYRLIFETAPNLILLLDKEGYIVNCNEKINDILGYDKKEVIGWSVYDLIHSNYHVQAQKAWNEPWIDGGTNSNSKEYRLVRKDDEEIDVSIDSSELKEGNGWKGWRIWMIEDITERKKMERKILEAHSHAEAYLDIMGHDIDNLNKAIKTYSELLLLKPDLSEQYKKYIQTTLQQSRSISDLILNIQKLSELKRDEFKLEKIDLFKILATASERVQRRYPHRCIRINQSISESEVLVKSNEMLIDVFYNIISNAIKFNSHDEVILEITHSPSDSEDGAFWKLEFKDNGPGVNDDIKKKIFQQFEKGNNNIRGAGLGLAVVHEIVTLSGGEIKVEDRISGNPEEGSNFIVLLPMIDV